MAIKSFNDSDTECVFNGLQTANLPPEIQPRANRKLMQVNAAGAVSDLRFPRGNRRHPLKDDREGQHSISINDQWRIFFRFEDGNAYEVEITDFH